ncbi:MAG: response regulator transcription factor [Candidatus Eremiobacteraeota bacterium]|nr:response regulator transcription factor [Candidatus Eremiobacteraeota bacterium]MBV8366044.1 response regulator transcription factor [Candidatus Eremiobacteraeota bacterium]
MGVGRISQPVNNGISILLVDDEPQIVEVLERYLSDEGFQIHKAYDGASAVTIAAAQRPSLVLLDLKLPGMSGFEAFREIRTASTVPIIMLTSRGEEVDRIVGLELGADDYITKPFSPREVVARIKAVLRRAHASPATVAAAPSSVIHNGDIEIDPQDHEVRVRGAVVALTPTEFRILELLAANPGRTFTRAQLLDKIKGDELEIYDRTLDRHVANLRHKIEADASSPRYVLTVFGVGYKMAKLS